MSKVLLIEPHRMLQQAITLSLFPEHEVEIAASVAEVSSLENFEVVIVDAMSTGETNELTARVVPEIEKRNTAMIWIEGGESPPPPKLKKLVVLIHPLERAALHSAVGQCLDSAPGAERNEAGSTPKDRNERSARETKSLPRAMATATTKKTKFIELTDVVQEGLETTGHVEEIKKI